ncbi:MAG: putative bifunctional diguanylate cyclase/phosphodiesterase [Acidimicrobiales bacterium]
MAGHSGGIRRAIMVGAALLAFAALALSTWFADVGRAHYQDALRGADIARLAESLRAAELEARSDGAVSPAVSARVEEATRRLDALIGELARRGSHAEELNRTSTSLDRFRANVAVELASLRAGNLDKANGNDAELTADSYADLQSATAEMANASRRKASAVHQTMATGQRVLVPAVLASVVLLVTVTERARRRDQLNALERRKDDRFRSLVQNATDLIVVTDEAGGVLYVTPSIEAILGRPAEEVLGADLRRHLHPGDLVEMVEGSVTARFAHADGSWRHLDGTTVDLRDDPSVQGFVWNLRDLTEQRALEGQLAHQALHDPLTGLANRVLFRDRTEQALARAARSRRAVTVLFLDLDGFKTINDSLGHDAGDEVLITVAERCKTCLRPGDTFARLGGDEFAVLLEDGDRSAGELVAGRIIEAIGRNVPVAGKEAPLSVSIGVAAGRSGPMSVDELLRNADTAMYAAKAEGKAVYRVFRPEMHEAAQARLELSAELRHAVARDELVLHYQPTVSLDDTRIDGFEALLRWRHPTRGLVAPLEFIPLAEETGAIIEIGAWVLDRACEEAARLAHLGLSMNVNLSPKQLAHKGLVGLVREVLERHRLDPGLLVLEITESTLMHDTDLAVAKLHELRRLGVRLAIDDFGTGYSSLNYLRLLPIDILKIDKAFVDSASSGNAQGEAFIQAMVKLGHTLELKTVAEGIETADQAAQLREVGCTAGQGYFYARPMPAERIDDVLEEFGLVTAAAATPGRRSG